MIFSNIYSSLSQLRLSLHKHFKNYWNDQSFIADNVLQKHSNHLFKSKAQPYLTCETWDLWALGPPSKGSQMTSEWCWIHTWRYLNFEHYSTHGGINLDILPTFLFLLLQTCCSCFIVFAQRNKYIYRMSHKIDPFSLLNDRFWTFYGDTLL